VLCVLFCWCVWVDWMEEMETGGVKEGSRVFERKNVLFNLKLKMVFWNVVKVKN